MIYTGWRSWATYIWVLGFSSPFVPVIPVSKMTWPQILSNSCPLPSWKKKCVSSPFCHPETKLSCRLFVFSPKVKSAKPTIDMTPPRTYNHLSLNVTRKVALYHFLTQFTSCPLGGSKLFRCWNHPAESHMRKIDKMSPNQIRYWSHSKNTIVFYPHSLSNKNSDKIQKQKCGSFFFLYLLCKINGFSY